MEPSNTLGPDEGGMRPGSFPLLSLPRELRDIIYVFALEPRADFLFRTLNGYEDKHHRPMRIGLQGFRIVQEVFSSDIEEEASGQYWKDGIMWLWYRLSASSALLFTCRQISLEVQEAMAFLGGLMESSLHYNRFAESPDTRFLDICSRSCFAILSISAAPSIKVLRGLPQPVRSRIKHVVFGVKWRNLSSRSFWVGAYTDENQVCILDYLAQTVPHVREVGIFVPFDHSDQSSTVPARLVEMLKRGEIDTLRLMDLNSSLPEGDCWFLRGSTLVENEPSHEQFIPVDGVVTFEEEKLGGGLCHIIEQWYHMKSKKRWPWLDAGSVVKMIRIEKGVERRRKMVIWDYNEELDC
ncbi:uncharacterized protein BDR25DRAFT_347464 [Lindgomyces ingoldianus]|uniref:Uncharacterized protein n=1 Tax=Lindgomyces ingoldianus TaxID=673940 RepID=A0ACB6Q864_9PLEO|nr:uncharacterized protein BDR25DRAFT_347464 [Lindgomyces ingoldianus]KAF2463099.1 hypothetical protein BDR25DRAFT_347464 [Lindgomyces ingoldianus]